MLYRQQLGAQSPMILPSFIVSQGINKTLNFKIRNITMLASAQNLITDLLTLHCSSFILLTGSHHEK
jgi:hypothetical protein